MPKAFSQRTLAKFEDASASIPLRQLIRAFEAAGIRLGEDPGGDKGTRKVQFRRYVAGVDQHVPRQLAQLGDALGTLIDEVATSKVDFLVQAAESDGFSFAGGVFRPEKAATSSFAVTNAEELSSIDERGRRLHVLARTNPNEAAAGAFTLLESVCRTVLSLVGATSARKGADIANIVKSALKALDVGPIGLQQLGPLVANLGDVRNAGSSRAERADKRTTLSPRQARLAVGLAVALAGFIAETCADRRPAPRGPLTGERKTAKR